MHPSQIAGGNQPPAQWGYEQAWRDHFRRCSVGKGARLGGAGVGWVRKSPRSTPPKNATGRSTPGKSPANPPSSLSEKRNERAWREHSIFSHLTFLTADADQPEQNDQTQRHTQQPHDHVCHTYSLNYVKFHRRSPLSAMLRGRGRPSLPVSPGDRSNDMDSPEAHQPPMQLPT
jgi:hypothetical protein